MISWTYSKKENATSIFELKTTIHNTKQGDFTIQHDSGFTARIGSTLTFSNENTRGCDNVVKNLGARLSLLIFRWA